MKQKLPYIYELVARKLSGAEKGRLDGVDISFREREYQRLERETERSTLPEKPAGRSAFNDLLDRLRSHGSNVRQD